MARANCSWHLQLAWLWTARHPQLAPKIAPEVIIHLTAADIHVDYDSALMVVQSSKARQYGDLVSRTKLFIKDVSQLCIASNS